MAGFLSLLLSFLLTFQSINPPFIGSHLNAENVSITSGGTLNLLAAADTSFAERKKTTESVMWQAQEGKGHTSTTYNMVSINAANVAVDADQINVDVAGGLPRHSETAAGEGNISSAISQVIAQANAANAPAPDVQQLVTAAAAQPGMEYLNQLQNNPNVNWNVVNNAYDSWDYKSQGLTPEGAAIIAIAVTAATMGAGSGAGAGVMAASSAGVTLTGASAAAANAAMAALASKAAVSLVNNRGDIGATLEDLATEDTVKELAVAALSAGAMDMAGSVLGYASAVPAAGSATNPTGALTSASLNIGQHATQILANSTISAGVNTAIYGGSFGDMWVENLKTGAVLAGASEAARFVGDRYHLAELLNGGDAPLNEDLIQLSSHGLIGCGAGAIMSGNCLAGGVGAVAGELGAEWADNVDFGRFIGASAGLLVSEGDGDSVYTALSTASNAIANNHMAFKINKSAANGNGHMTGYFQDENGVWYKYDQYTTETEAGIMDFLLNKGFEEGINIEMIGYVDERLYFQLKDDVVFIKTTKKQDELISDKAFWQEITTDERQYHLWTNNCLDSFQDVCSAGGVDLPIDFDPRPNSYFEKLKEQYPDNFINRAYDDEKK